MTTFKDFRNNVKPNWCPGCGDFSVQAAIQRAAANVGLEPENLAVISGIGCSGRISGYINSYGLHGIHGRSLPIAQGVKMANRDLTVIASGGDGDGFAIGMGHTIHSIRRNIDITYIMMDNQIYGLTKGHLSPTSPKGLHTVTSGYGSLENPINPLLYTLAYGAPFVAQGTPADMAGLASILEEAIRYPGFSFVNVQSPCVTYGEECQQVKAQKTKMKPLASLGDDASNLLSALDLSRSYGTELYTGVLYRNPQPPPSMDAQVVERQQRLAQGALPRERILDLFVQK